MARGEWHIDELNIMLGTEGPTHLTDCSAHGKHKC